MLKESLFKKMKTWNTVGIVITIISTIMAIIGAITLVAMSKSPEMLSQLKASGMDTAIYKFSTMDMIVSVVVILIQIVCVVLMFMNSGKMNKLENINIMPYILLIILQIYSVINSVISMTILGGGLAGVSAIIGMIIGLFLGAGPSIIVLLKNKKINSIEEENQDVEEE